MSLKRFAIIAPLSYHHYNHKHNKTQSMLSAATTTAATVPWTLHQNITIANRQQWPSYNDELESYRAESNASNEIATYNSNNGGWSFGSADVHGMPSSIGNSKGGSDHTHLNGINGNVNLLLGGAMLSLMTTILCIVCYCCHRSIKKRTEAAYRQQRQWHESDPNMEIYSVEQCYETSGLFLGESTDGLASLTALHHEPPPSYNTVIAMQEQQMLRQQLLQQQQQLLYLQHNSPPPGYRSTLDVCNTAENTPPETATTTTIAATLLRSPSGTDSVGSAISSPNFPQFSKQIAAYNNNGADGVSNATLLSMKKALSAQSCCSLQRAEVENMWNAAAAAVVARAAHGVPQLNDGDSNSCCSEATGVDQARRQATSATMPRKSLPLTLAARFATINRVARPHLLPQSSASYRHGCPLCGKFQNDLEETLTMSRESGLDGPTAMITTTSLNELPNAFHVNGYTRSDSDLHSSNKQHQQTAINEQSPPPHDNAETISALETCVNNTQQDECLCSMTTMAVHVPAAASSYTVCDDNGNVSDSQLLALMPTLDSNANHNLPTTTASTDCNTETASSSAVTAVQPMHSDVALDTINGNSGIIRVDMSKVIDPSGLPTYDAALKLESCGYV